MQTVYLTTFFLDKLSPLSSLQLRVHVSSPETYNSPSGKVKGENNRRKKHLMINLYERMLPDLAVIKSVTPDHQSNVHLTVSPRPAPCKT